MKDNYKLCAKCLQQWSRGTKSNVWQPPVKYWLLLHQTQYTTLLLRQNMLQVQCKFCASSAAHSHWAADPAMTINTVWCVTPCSKICCKCNVNFVLLLQHIHTGQQTQQWQSTLCGAWHLGRLVTVLVIGRRSSGSVWWLGRMCCVRTCDVRQRWAMRSLTCIVMQLQKPGIRKWDASLWLGTTLLILSYPELKWIECDNLMSEKF